MILMVNVRTLTSAQKVIAVSKEPNVGIRLALTDVSVKQVISEMELSAIMVNVLIKCFVKKTSSASAQLVSNVNVKRAFIGIHSIAHARIQTSVVQICMLAP